LEHLCGSAQQFSKIIANWEQSELAIQVLSVMEQTEDSLVLTEGLKIFIAMQESSYLLGPELSQRINSIN
jgi:hypothetical protein